LQFQLKDGREITVRDYKPADFDGIVAMFQRLNKEALRFGLPPYDRPRLERWITGLGDGILLLALSEESVVGVAMVFGRSLAGLKGIGEFVIYIHQDYQSQGLGTFLTRTLLDRARRSGFHRIGLGVVADNVNAVKTYERTGFVVEGRLKDAFFGHDGRYRDQLIMGIIL